jgi:hypothetical protein
LATPARAYRANYARPTPRCAPEPTHRSSPSCAEYAKRDATDWRRRQMTEALDLGQHLLPALAGTPRAIRPRRIQDPSRLEGVLPPRRRLVLTTRRGTEKALLERVGIAHSGERLAECR